MSISRQWQHHSSPLPSTHVWDGPCIKPTATHTISKCRLWTAVCLRMIKKLCMKNSRNNMKGIKRGRMLLSYPGRPTTQHYLQMKWGVEEDCNSWSQSFNEMVTMMSKMWSDRDSTFRTNREGVLQLLFVVHAVCWPKGKT